MLQLQIALAVVLSVSAVLFLSSPALWIFLIWAVAGFGAAYASRTRPARIVLFNVGAVALILAGAEVLLGLRVERDRVQSFDPPRFVIKEPGLGHRALPNSRVRARLTVGDESRYDVIYTTGPYGLRIGPPESPADPASCALFLGCSFTFGEGVNDEEAMPYVAGVVSGGDYRIRNFGFLGYGPHNMLAAIETGWVEQAANCQPKYAIYWAQLHHVLRAAGKWSWDTNGPRYRLRENGTVVRDGNFESSRSAFGDTSEVATLVTRIRDSAGIAPEDIELFFAIVRESRAALERLYPGIEFHVLYWDTERDPEALRKGWKRYGFHVHRLSQILPDWSDRKSLYQQPDDSHPNARADELIGRYVANEILR